MTPSRRSLRAMLEQDGYVLAPGAGSALEARLIDRAGFEAIYLSGYAAAAVTHALPDVGITAAAEIVATATAIANVTDLPLIVDADTGYGDVANVRDVVRKLERGGAQAIQIEDQSWPKRCGHMAGKTVIGVDEMLRKVSAALASRRDPETIIIARTDARAPLGFDEAIRRAELYAQAGADLTFIDAPESTDELERICAEVPGRCVVNMTESGKTPLHDAEELRAMGFALVLFPTTGLRTMARAVAQYLAELRETGSIKHLPQPAWSLDELNAAVGLGELDDWADDLTGATVAAQS